jgi:uncharacterized protein (DUF362 family)
VLIGHPRRNSVENKGKLKSSFVEKIVALRTLGKCDYPLASPFHPPEAYPEFNASGIDASNDVYPAVRQLFADLCFDKDRFGAPQWNPLGEIIKPGMTVFIKPNTVVHKHQKNKELFSIIVHPSIIRAVLDYACKALENNGTIIIGDSQLYSSNYDKMMAESGLGELLHWYKEQTSVSIQWFDLRLNRARRTWLYGRWDRVKIEHDPLGYQFVNLGDDSRFVGIDPSRLRIAVASHKNMYKHHRNGRHEYLFPRTFLKSDVVINIAKLKTHRRTGVTLALKNYMGIPAYKDSLPHFITGSKAEGGDQYINPSGRKKIITFLHDVVQSSRFLPVKFVCAIVKKILWNSHYVIPFKDDIYEAMWWGNDTLWRTLSDLNQAVEYADKEGVIQKNPQRKQLALIDGIISGEGDGPLACDPVYSGVLFAGSAPAIVDAIAATFMGFDVQKIPLIKNAFKGGKNHHPLFNGTIEEIAVQSYGEVLTFEAFRRLDHKRFKPHLQWAGHVELTSK